MPRQIFGARILEWQLELGDFAITYTSTSLGIADREPLCYFGGPDHPSGALRDVLAACIRETPADGAIDWATYYFRDRQLAWELVQARRRGVRVTVILEQKPRVARANEEVIKLLSGSRGLGDGLQLVRLPGVNAPGGKAWKPQFHQKIYCFSGPRPLALVGSFNPSGDRNEEKPEVVAEIGDHDVADNVLVGLQSQPLVHALQQHVRSFSARPPRVRDRVVGVAPDITCDGIRICFWPRRGQHPIIEALQHVSPDAEIKIAASHIRDSRSIAVLRNLARRGVRIQLLAESTTRRVTPTAETRLRDGGVEIARVSTPEQNVPMHLKLVLIRDKHAVTSVFGSFNWTKPSLYLNNEVAVFSDDQRLFDILEWRWSEIAARSFHSSAPEVQLEAGFGG